VGKLEPDDELLRDVPLKEGFFEWDGRSGRWIPALAAMHFDPDGLSTFVERMLILNGHSVADVSNRGGTVDRDSVIYSVRNQAALTYYDTSHTPNLDSPIGYAHSSIMKKQSMTSKQHKNARRSLAPLMRCVYGEVPFEPPPNQGVA